MTIECKTVRGRWKSEEHDWERTGGLIWWKIHSGRENQKESKSREASLAMSCMYRGLVRKRERKHWATSKKDCVFAAHIHKHETESCTAFPLCLSWPSSPSSSLCLSDVLFFQKYPFVNSNGFRTDSHTSLRVTAVFSVPSMVWWCACVSFWFTYFLHFLTCGVQTSGRYGASS